MDEVVDLEHIYVNKVAIERVSKELCNYYNIFPFEVKENLLFIASTNKDEGNFKEELSFILKSEVKLFLCHKKQLLAYISKFYEEEYRIEALKELEDKGEGIIEEGSFAISSPATFLVESILKEGIYNEASDIHIEPSREEVKVRFRVDGVLRLHTKIHIKAFQGIITRIKILGGMNIGAKYIPQDGEISYQLQEETYQFRVSLLPTIHGEKCVLRLLKKNTKLLNLKNLGFEEKDYFTLKNILRLKQGLIIVTGATGSGKTTTLYSLLNELNSDSKNIITLEKPVECQLQGLNQVSIEGIGNNTYIEIAKTALRQDPDVIMIGEILDKATAEVAINAALTGHLVLTTLHTNDASSTILRLKNMGISEELLRDSITVIISQRLIRCICKECKEALPLLMEEKQLLNLEGDVYGYKGRGCSRCSNTGYRGRTLAYEMMIINKRIKEVLNKSDVEALRTRAEEEGMIAIDKYLKSAVEKGITTVEEYYDNMQVYNIEKVIGVKYDS